MLLGYHDQAALRRLANRLIGILHGCLKTGTLYETTAWVARAHLKPAELVNENPGWMTVAGLRYLMKHHPWTRELDPPRFRRARDASFVEERGRGWFAQPFTSVDADCAVRIAAHFAADNEAFVQHHWQRSWSDVFAADATRRWSATRSTRMRRPRKWSTTWPRTRTPSSPR